MNFEPDGAANAFYKYLRKHEPADDNTKAVMFTMAVALCAYGLDGAEEKATRELHETVEKAAIGEGTISQAQLELYCIGVMQRFFNKIVPEEEKTDDTHPKS